MMRRMPALLLALLLPGALRADQQMLHLDIGDPARKGREVRLVLDAITDTVTGEILAPREFARRLAGTGMLFIGENHTSQAFHDVQYQAVRALHESGRKVLIGVEMFPYTEQAVLDDWNARRLTSEGFVQTARWYDQWDYHWHYYRDIFLYAQANGIGIHAVNCPRDLVRAVRSGGFGSLSAEQAAHLPPTLAPDDDEHRRLYRAHFAGGDSLHLNAQAIEGMYRAQTMWDACMGWNALQALRRMGGDGAIMIVLAGAGHVAFGLGSERQIAAHYDGRSASLMPVPVRDDTGEPITGVRASYASFLWAVPPETDEAYPRLGLSLMGRFGAEPGQVIRVQADSVAARAGVREGDVLLAIDGATVSSDRALGALMAEHRWGDVVEARIRRDGAEQLLMIAIRRSDGGGAR
jgi:uncharacterized iron-regulated protein